MNALQAIYFLEAHVTAKASHSNLEVHLKHTLLINDVLILYVAVCSYMHVEVGR